MCTNLKPDGALFNSVFIGRFFNQVADTYANRKEQRPRYFPAIDLSDDDYELGLMNSETYNTISNVNVSNNKFYFDENDVEITIPERSYELRTINEFLKHAIPRKRLQHMIMMMIKNVASPMMMRMKISR